MAKGKRAANGDEPNKRQMVEAAIDTLGDPGPKEIQAYVKEHNGIDLPYAMAASYKSNIKKKRAGGGSAGNARRSGGGGGASGGSVPLKDLEAVKELLSRHGAAGLNDLIKLMG